MKSLTRLVFAIATVAIFTSCTRTGNKTYNYLREVGRIRALYNTDAQERVLNVRQLQFDKLLEAANRTDEYKQTLIGFSTDGVDSEAIQFTQNLESFLDAVKSMYLDTAHLIQEEQKARAHHFGPSPVLPILKGAVALADDNTGGVIAAVGELLDVLGKENAARRQFLAPYITQVRESREHVMAARQAFHQQADQTKADFTKRYPNNDWTLSEVLPQ
jgi:hypothetical protein